MICPTYIRRRGLVSACAFCLLFLLASITALASPQDDNVAVTVVVKEADSNEPINQAHLTLIFRIPGDQSKLKLPKHYSFTAKTNAQGRYTFTDIHKGTIRLLVTADRHQTFGKDFELTEPNQVIEVKLKRPQPIE